MLKEKQGHIERTMLRNPLEFDYTEPLLQIQVQEHSMGWHAQLLFFIEDAIPLFNEFGVRFMHELHEMNCFLLIDDEKPSSVPCGIKFDENSEYIEVKNESIYI